MDKILIDNNSVDFILENEETFIIIFVQSVDIVLHFVYITI